MSLLSESKFVILQPGQSGSFISTTHLDTTKLIGFLVGCKESVIFGDIIEDTHNIIKKYTLYGEQMKTQYVELKTIQVFEFLDNMLSRKRTYICNCMTPFNCICGSELFGNSSSQINVFNTEVFNTEQPKKKQRT